MTNVNAPFHEQDQSEVDDIPYIFVRRDAGNSNSVAEDSNQGDNPMIHNCPNVIQHFDPMADETAQPSTATVTTMASAPALLPAQLPPGKYAARIDNVQVDTKEYDIVRMEFTIMSGPYAGQQDMKWYHLKSPKSCKFFQKEFGTIGVSIGSRLDLLAKSREAIGREIMITVSYGDNGNKAIYVNGVNPKPAVAPVNLEDVWK